jgi:predicted nucleic acid-binding protein
MKKTVYLDTTVLSYLFDERESLRSLTELTRRWWKTQGRSYRLFLSAETLAELRDGNYDHKAQSLKEASSIEILRRTDDIETIAKVYVDNLLMPKKVEGDAIHLAYASVYKMDFLLTWNCDHLANANKKQHIRIINTKLGLVVPEIITPMELFKEDMS